MITLYRFSGGPLDGQYRKSTQRVLLAPVELASSGYKVARYEEIRTADPDDNVMLFTGWDESSTSKPFKPSPKFSPTSYVSLNFCGESYLLAQYVDGSEDWWIYDRDSWGWVQFPLRKPGAGISYEHSERLRRLREFLQSHGKNN